MSQNLTSLPEDLEQLQQQLAEFRRPHPVRSRLPETLWSAAHRSSNPLRCASDRAGAAP